jgi:outer membrane protein TolC
MRRPYSLVTVLLCFSLSLQSQSTLGALLISVEANNKTILAERQRTEASAATYQTGLSLPDPTVVFDWMKGFPSAAGNQTELIAAQAFDFPTAYRYRRQISGLQGARARSESDLLRRDILLEAQLLALRAISLRKRKTEVTRRLISTEQFLENYRKKLERQDATIIDVRKAQLQLLNTRTDLDLLDTQIDEVSRQLTALNGGIPVAFNDTIYPEIPVLPAFDSLYAEIQSTDPALRYLEVQKQIAVAQISLTRAELLPKFEAGYRYQGILDQHFHGIHTGIQLPLWENKKRLRATTLQSQVYDARIAERQTELYQEALQLFDQYRALQVQVEAYRSNLATVADHTLLDKALQAGQITVLEYFIETSLYYDSIDRYLDLEELQHRTLSRLLQHRL